MTKSQLQAHAAVISQWEFILLDPHVTCCYNTKRFASGFHGRVGLFLAFPEPEVGMQEGGSSLHHIHVPLLKHSQPWCPSVLSFYLSLVEIGESTLSFVAFGFPHQGLDSLPPSLAAFSPWEHGVLVYMGFGMQKEALFYSLRKKQVPVSSSGGGRAALCVTLGHRGGVGSGSCSGNRFSSCKPPSVAQVSSRALPLPQAASRQAASP